jgi:hypothetical protein
MLVRLIPIHYNRAYSLQSNLDGTKQIIYVPSIPLWPWPHFLDHKGIFKIDVKTFSSPAHLYLVSSSPDPVMQRATFINYDAKHRQTTGRDLSTINSHISTNVHSKRAEDAKNQFLACPDAVRQSTFAISLPSIQPDGSVSGPLKELLIRNRDFIQQALDSSRWPFKDSVSAQKLEADVFRCR